VGLCGYGYSNWEGERRGEAMSEKEQRRKKRKILQTRDTPTPTNTLTEARSMVTN
jgi:hypothetical protein